MNQYNHNKDERQSQWEEERSHRMRRSQRHQNENHLWTGIFILAVGGLALMRSMDVPLPKWLFSWQMLLIGIGLLIGIKSRFKDTGWFVPCIIGLAFLINEYVMLGGLRKHFWPLILIVIGLFFILRPRKKNWFGWNSKAKSDPHDIETITPISESSYSDDDVIDITSIFGGSKKIVLSKNFKGGEMVNIFGGAEIDLTQADMTTPARLEVVAIFGGATLIIPSNWAIKSEAFTMFGGISDKRKIHASADGPTRTIILDGTILFGGLEIKSY